MRVLVSKSCHTIQLLRDKLNYVEWKYFRFDKLNANTLSLIHIPFKFDMQTVLENESGLLEMEFVASLCTYRVFAGLLRISQAQAIDSIFSLWPLSVLDNEICLAFIDTSRLWYLI